MSTPVLRESTDDDLEAMMAVTGRHWLATTGLVHPMNVERLRTVRSFPGREPGLDSPVVELDGRVVAWGTFFAFPPYSQVFLGTAISPDLDESDHDTCVGLLVDHATRIARDRLASAGIELDPERMLATDAVHSDTRLCDALERRGFTFDRHELEMAIDLDGIEVALAPLPDGVTVRRAHVVDDALVVAAVLREAFLDHHGDTPFTDDVVSESLREEARPGATLLAEDADGPVAAIIGRDRGEGGYVWAVGVLRRGRRSGLASALLTRAFADFAAGGRTLVTLDVDAESLTGATRVYERLGMRTRVVLDEYVRSLTTELRT